MKKTAEELMALAKKGGHELSPEQANELSMKELSDEDVEMIGGGELDSTSIDFCPNSIGGYHGFRKTGNTRPGMLWGLNWEVQCINCGRTEWRIWEPKESETGA